MIRVRFAPSPTGFLHLGGLRTALYNYLFAKQNKGRFIMRIEDTDRVHLSRYVEGAVENMEKVFKNLGINFDESVCIGGEYGPYKQSERRNIYKSFAEKLVNDGHAYKCFCSPERLAMIRQTGINRGQPFKYDRKCFHLSKDEINQNVTNGVPYVIRMKIPDGQTVFKDEIHGETIFKNNTIDDQIIMKSDGMPTYHLANVIDDHLMKISHVIRGEEWLTSTPKHIILYQSLGLQIPKFAHLPLLLNEDKKKLSKRHSSAHVEKYIEDGYFADAILNYVALLGWSPEGGSGADVLTRQELIQKFSLDKVSKTNVVVHEHLLHELNKAHMKLMFADPTKRSNFVDVIRKTVPLTDRYSNDYLENVYSVLCDRITNLSNLNSLYAYFFTQPQIDLVQVEKMLFNNEPIKEFIKTRKGRKLHRYILTGTNVGPSLGEIQRVLGPEEVERRIKYACEKV